MGIKETGCREPFLGVFATVLFLGVWALYIVAAVATCSGHGW